MKRIPEVLDVWFDSGVTSWAALNYPKEKRAFEKYWPADLNIEGRDQFRGWWNSQMILSEITFGKKPFENIAVHGMVLDLGKKKMSKSLGNITTPQDVINEYNRDYLRYYFAKLSKGEDFLYDKKEFNEIRKVITTLLNINNFVNQIPDKKNKKNVEDLWITSKFNSLSKKVKENYNSFKFFEVIQRIENFMINDLSRNYIQIIRERSDETYSTLNDIRIGLLKLLAPVIPFLTEKIWQDLRKKKIVQEESIHLSDLHSTDEKKIDSVLEIAFEKINKVIELGLAERDKAKIGLRWPLAKAIVYIDQNVRMNTKK